MKTKTHSTEQIVEERVSLRFSDFSVLFEKNEYPYLSHNSSMISKNDPGSFFPRFDHITNSEV
jgi:hypothetical protein